MSTYETPFYGAKAVYYISSVTRGLSGWTFHWGRLSSARFSGGIYTSAAGAQGAKTEKIAELVEHDCTVLCVHGARILEYHFPHASGLASL